MYKETLRAIDGIGLFPVVSLLLFVTVFTVALVRVLRMDRGHVARLASLPMISIGARANQPSSCSTIASVNGSSPVAHGALQIRSGRPRRSSVSLGTRWATAARI